MGHSCWLVVCLGMESRKRLAEVNKEDIFLQKGGVGQVYIVDGRDKLCENMRSYRGLWLRVTIVSVCGWPKLL